MNPSAGLYSTTVWTCISGSSYDSFVITVVMSDSYCDNTVFKLSVHKHYWFLIYTCGFKCFVITFVESKFQNTVINHCVGYTTISAVSPEAVTKLYYPEVTCPLKLHHVHFCVVGWCSDKNYAFLMG